MTDYRASGFTLVELMITLLVGAILLTVAVPSMQTLIRNNRLTTQTNEFVSTLQLARSEAAKRNVPITILANAPEASNEFGAGWILFQDADGDGTLDADEETIRSVGALSDNNTLDATPDTSTFRFLPTGLVDTGATITFDVCHASGLPGREVTMLITGRVSTREIDACP